MGILLVNSEGEIDNKKKGFELFQKAAEKNMTLAYFHLGFGYEKGQKKKIKI